MKKSIFLGLSLLIISCGEQLKKQIVRTDKQSNIIEADSLSIIDTSTIVFKDSTISWESLQDFHKRLDGFKKVNSTADLKLLTEELIELELAIEEVEVPELFNTDAVKSRLILIRTYLNQLHAYIELDQELTQAVNQILESHLSLLNKLNLIESNANAPKLSQNDLE